MSPHEGAVHTELIRSVPPTSECMNRAMDIEMSRKPCHRSERVVPKGKTISKPVTTVMIKNRSVVIIMNPIKTNRCKIKSKRKMKSGTIIPIEIGIISESGTGDSVNLPISIGLDRFVIDFIVIIFLTTVHGRRANHRKRSKATAEQYCG